MLLVRAINRFPTSEDPCETTRMYRLYEHSQVAYEISSQFPCVTSFLFAGLTFISSPLIGMQSDRSTFSVGKRRPMMILGAIALW